MEHCSKTMNSKKSIQRSWDLKLNHQKLNIDQLLSLFCLVSFIEIIVWSRPFWVSFKDFFSGNFRGECQRRTISSKVRKRIRATWVHVNLFLEFWLSQNSERKKKSHMLFTCDPRKSAPGPGPGGLYSHRLCMKDGQHIATYSFCTKRWHLVVDVGRSQSLCSRDRAVEVLAQSWVELSCQSWSFMWFL